MLGRRLVLLVLTALPLLCAPAAHAEDAIAYTPPDFLSATPPLAAFDASRAWRLDLGEALQLAVKQNLGVTLERYTVRETALGVTVASGLFEPTLDASYAHGSFRTPPSSAQEGMPGEILELADDRWRVSLGERL